MSCLTMMLRYFRNIRLAVTSTCNLIPVFLSRDTSFAKRLKLALFGSACQLSVAGSEDKITQTNAAHTKDDIKQKGHANEPKFPVHSDA